MDKLEISNNLRDYEGGEVAEAYNKLQPPYPDEIRQEVLKCLQKNATQGAGQRFMLDVGCGGGRSTKLFVNDFERILGIDISQSQIDVARRRVTKSNVTFQVVHDNLLPVEDGSTDVVFCGVSVHYLNIPVFLAECDRVLVPGGLVVCAICSPDALKCVDGQILCDYSPESTEPSKLDYLRIEFADNCGADRNVAKIYFNRYKGVFESIANPTKRHFPIAEIEEKFTVNAFLKMESTIGGYGKSSYPNPEQDPLHIYREGLYKVFQDAGMKCGDDTEVFVTTRFTLMMIEKTKDFGIA